MESPKRAMVRTGSSPPMGGRVGVGVGVEIKAGMTATDAPRTVPVEGSLEGIGVEVGVVEGKLKPMVTS